MGKKDNIKTCFFVFGVMNKAILFISKINIELSSKLEAVSCRQDSCHAVFWQLSGSRQAVIVQLSFIVQPLRQKSLFSLV